VDSSATSKSELRAAALARRDALPVADRRAAAQAIAAQAFPVPFGDGTIVAGYSPIRSECDPVPLMRRLAAKGAELALPVVDETGKPLSFAEWHFGAQLVAGPHGILQPRPEVAGVHPDIVLVPLVAFDRRGHRLGYGAGYFDRTLAGLRRAAPVIAVGIAFAVQEVDAIPADEHDEPLDLVLTERGVIDPRGI
jgi:5-formyltetrahydrofolate cyclo-ligase